MPSTKDATLQSIQREISEIIQREKELKENYSRLESENELTTLQSTATHKKSKPPLERAKSVSSLSNGHNNSINGTRLFTQNPTKGVMHRFLKSKGKISTVTGVINNNQVTTSAWSALDLPEPIKPVVPPGVQPRNGFIPIEERIKKEFKEMQMRETELKTERRKSQPDLLALFDSEHESEPVPGRWSLPSSQSVSHLNDFDTYDESMSAPSSLKTARSLADLCDLEDEEDQPPGSLTLIKQWENLIKKNQP